MMPDSGRDHDGESTEDEPNLWAKAGIAAALGFELVGFVLAGAFIGVHIDAYFDSSPVGLLASMGLAFVAAGLHIYRMTRRFLIDDDDQ